MNFIEQALKDLTNGEAFVQAMADIYEYPEGIEKAHEEISMQVER